MSERACDETGAIEKASPNGIKSNGPRQKDRCANQSLRSVSLAEQQLGSWRGVSKADLAAGFHRGHLGRLRDREIRNRKAAMGAFIAKNIKPSKTRVACLLLMKASHSQHFSASHPVISCRLGWYQASCSQLEKHRIHSLAQEPPHTFTPDDLKDSLYRYNLRTHHP